MGNVLCQQTSADRGLYAESIYIFKALCELCFTVNKIFHQFFSQLLVPDPDDFIVKSEQ